MAKEVAGVAFDDSQAGTISCPHCGAPVKYATPDPPAPPADGDDGDAMDGGAGAMDELDDAAAGLEEMDDAGGELMEPSTDADDDGDPSVSNLVKKTESVDADDVPDSADGAAMDDVAADDVAADEVSADDVAADDVAADDVAADDAVAAAAMVKPQVPAPKSGAVVAKKMAGVKVPKPAPKVGPGQGAAPPPAAPAPKMNGPAAPAPSAAMREMRRMSERLATLEQREEVAAKQRRARVALSLLRRGLKEGKLTPKMIQPGKETRKFAFRDPKGFARWLAEEAKVVVDYRERGTVKGETQDSAASTAASIDQRARAMMERDKSLDYKTATVNVLSENRQLAERYDREMSGTGPREIKAISSRTSVK